MRDFLRWMVLGCLFAVPFVPLIVTGSLFFSYITGKAFAFRILVETAFAAWVVLALYAKEYRPRFSWIFVTLATFVGVLFVADIFGVAPMKSLWSNFERMEGFVTLAHLLLYFIVIGSVLEVERLWDRFFNVSLIAAALVALFAFGELAGFTPIAQGSRINATLGNAIYMAVYMLFHVFIALLMLVRSTQKGWRICYGSLAVAFAFLLVWTETRGATIGLVGGLFFTALSMAWMSRENHTVRKTALIGMAVLLLMSGVFYLLRDSAVVRNSSVLRRVASISLAEGQTRFTIWGIALEGAKAHPILGWGQNNFDYVFDLYYRPSLYAQEPWFDRVHNSYLDWLIAGGVLGLAAYLAIWVSVFLVLGRRTPLINERGRKEKKDEALSVAERSILIGVLVGYGLHSVFVFDNLISYIFFVTILALVHAKTAREIPQVTSYVMREQVLAHIATPVTGVLLCISLYVVNVPSLLAAHDLIDALRAFDSTTRGAGMTATGYTVLLKQQLDDFRRALGRGSLGDQEIREQLALATQRVNQDTHASAELKQAYISLAEEELKKHLAYDPDSARMHVFLGTLYRAVGKPEQALAEYAIVEKLSPDRQHNLFSIGATFLETGQYQKAEEVFRRTFLLAPEFDDARVYYIVSAIYTGNEALVAELSIPPYDVLLRNDDRIMQAYYGTKKYAVVLSLLEERIIKTPGDVQLRVSKAVVQHDMGSTADAVVTLKQAIKDFPDFKAQGEAFIAEIQK